MSDSKTEVWKNILDDLIQTIDKVHVPKLMKISMMEGDTTITSTVEASIYGKFYLFALFRLYPGRLYHLIDPDKSRECNKKIAIKQDVSSRELNLDDIAVLDINADKKIREEGEVPWEYDDASGLADRIQKNLEKCDYVITQVGLARIRKEGDDDKENREILDNRHSNLLLVQRCRGQTFVGIYEPHGYTYIPESYNVLLEEMRKRGMKPVPHQDMCYVGLQRKLHADTGLCWVINSLFIFCFIRILAGYRKRGIPPICLADLAGIIEEYIMNRKGSDMVNFLTKFAFYFSTMARESGYFVKNLYELDAYVLERINEKNREYRLDKKEAGKKRCMSDESCKTKKCVNNYCCTKREVNDPENEACYIESYPPEMIPGKYGKIKKHTAGRRREKPKSWLEKVLGYIW